MNNHMYMAPVNYRQIEQFPGYGGQDSRLWGGFGFGFPFFGGFPFFI